MTSATQPPPIPQQQSAVIPERLPTMNPPPQRVIITGINISVGDSMMLMLKLMIAAAPAALAVWFIIAVVGVATCGALGR